MGGIKSPYRVRAACSREAIAGLCQAARPLGPHPVVLDLLRRRLDETLTASAAAVQAST
jgi:hypothetical protein